MMGSTKLYFGWDTWMMSWKDLKIREAERRGGARLDFGLERGIDKNKFRWQSTAFDKNMALGV